MVLIYENMIEEVRLLNHEMKIYVSGCDKLPFENR